MIGYLNGTVKFKQIDSIILDIAGVGYLVFLPFYNLSECSLGANKEFYIFTYVKEDEITLFGFSSLEDKQIFLLLNKVSGIGPKTALNVLSYTNGAKNIIQAVQNADVGF